MIINHNIPALNTYRQLGINQNATQNSMEKLSSGLRINRAGDDAAGLAISEKMRAQIRGLDQASRNAADGISLIQTAEGALQETHNILQRMRELATQASNDTNVGVDREEIQKEMNQLTSEINRVGNTTEFNTRKILNGDVAVTGNGRTVDSGAATTTLGTGITDVNVDPTATAATGVYDVKVTSDTVAQIEDNTYSNVTDADVTPGDTVDLSGGAYKIAITEENTKQLDGSATDSDGILDTSNNNTAITLESNSTLNDAQHDLTVDKQQIYSSLGGGLDITSGTVDGTESGTYVIETSRTLDQASISDNDALMNDGVISNFTMSENATQAQADLINNGDANSLTVGVADNGNGTADFKFTFSDGTNSSDVTITGSQGDGAKTVQLAGVQFDVDVDKLADGIDWAGGGTSTYNSQSIAIGSGAAMDEVTVTKGADTVTSTVASGADGTVTFDLDGDSNDDFSLDIDSANYVSGNTINTTVQSEYTISLEENGGSQIGTDTVVNELDIASNPNALTNLSFGGSGVLIDLDSDALKNLTSGSSSTVNFDVKTDNGYTAELQEADGSAVDGAKYSLDTNAADGSTIDLGRDVNLTYDGADLSGDGEIFFGVNSNVTEYTFDLTDDGGTTTYDTQTVRAGETVNFSNGISLETDENTLTNSSNTTFEISDDTIDNSLQMQIGANNGQSFNIAISDMRAEALGVSGSSSSDPITDSDGNTITNASFTAEENVSDGTSNTNSEFALDVSTHEKASAAIEVINNAIEKVSAERSSLGASQNRLDHTISNLDNSSENLTAAESRIRDVDMAKEMMEMTRANILSQASQSMLAQANQAPQSVLQLLG